MKQEPFFFLRDGKIYDAQDKIKIFRGLVVHVPKIPFEQRLGQNIQPQDAKSFFLNLKHKGINLVVWQLPWEAVEPDEPEKYDEEYLAQLRSILKQAEEQEIFVVVQPVIANWCRMTDGEGAPLWTLEAAGIDLKKLKEAGGAAQHFVQLNKLKKGNPIFEYIQSTMFTLFWAGKDFAPNMIVDGDNIQDYLQNHFIAAMKHVARRIKDCKTVIGFSCLAEAQQGFVGMQGPAKFDLIKAASAIPITYKRNSGKLLFAKQSSELIFSSPTTIFKDSNVCLWQQAQMWHADKNQNAFLDRPDYFLPTNGKDFAEDYMKPFQQNFIEAFQKKHGHYLFLSEPCTNGQRVTWKLADKASDDYNFAVEKEGGVLPNFDFEASKIIATYIVPNMPKTLTGRVDVKNLEKKLEEQMFRAKKGGFPALGIFCMQANQLICELLNRNNESYVLNGLN